MEENLAQKSVRLALDNNWVEAINVNLKILKIDPEDVDCLNRLAKAYFECGKIDKAKSTSKKVLSIDPNNNIAKNSLIKFKSGTIKKTSLNAEKINFIEEPGKTKITSLLNLGSEKIYSTLNIGDELYLATHAHKVSVTTKSNKYIGKLADDISARLRISIKNGAKYTVYVKSVNKGAVKIFIKSNVLSFPLDKSEPLSEFRS